MARHVVRTVTALIGAVLALGLTAFSDPLHTQVHWTDPTGVEGKADFQGLADGSSLEGQLDFGGQTLLVTGSIGEGGAVDGTVKTQQGQTVLTFATTFVGGELGGEFTVTGTEPGVWMTSTPPPSDKIPDAPER
jgi:hypothetical protein